MGLDTSHGAFHGAYSAFNRLRQAVCRAAGGSFPYHKFQPEGFPPHRLDCEPDNDDRWYVPDEVTREAWPGLYLFLCHSDCDGDFVPEECVLVARDLERLLPELEKFPAETHGHLAIHGGYADNVRQFIAGCKAAAEANEPLDFH